jgi:hypothetical protein
MVLDQRKKNDERKVPMNIDVRGSHEYECGDDMRVFMDGVRKAHE